MKGWKTLDTDIDNLALDMLRKKKRFRYVPDTTASDGGHRWKLVRQIPQANSKIHQLRCYVETPDHGEGLEARSVTIESEHNHMRHTRQCQHYIEIKTHVDYFLEIFVVQLVVDLDEDIAASLEPMPVVAKRRGLAAQRTQRLMVLERIK